ncbi:hypothetical protein EIP91_007698 [Steccherinum ochraceum]|uniref:Uncharacterized protein n=1 Tax=Steccherinum ochraceum TaxID=92696 RepID=A0A4R0R3V7_9APHY|nr:hypothetical protein EIP91_007698 [Steccherinum ochraceum]
MAANAGSNLGEKVKGAFESVWDAGESIRVSAMDFVDAATGTSGRHENTPRYSQHHNTHTRERDYDRHSVSPRAPHSVPPAPNLPARNVEESGPFTTTGSAPGTQSSDARNASPSPTLVESKPPTRARTGSASAATQSSSYASDVQGGNEKRGLGSMTVSAADARKAAQAQIDAREKAHVSPKEEKQSTNANTQPVASTSQSWPGDDGTSTSKSDAQ